MASGKLGSANLLAASTDVLMYTVPVGSIAQINARFVNTNAIGNALVRLAIGTGGSPATSDYLEYDFTLNPSGLIEDTGIVMAASEKLWMRTNLDNVSARVHGFEEVRAAGSGLLGSRDLQIADGNYLLYTTPASTTTTANIRFCNRNAVNARIKLGIGTGAAPAASDWIEFNAPVPPNGIVEDTLISLLAGEKIWVITDTNNISVRAYGVAEAP